MLEVAEFFAGIGLVRLALEASERERWRVVFANDHDAGKAEIYRAMHPGGGAELRVCGVEALRRADVPPADLWTVSFPCTDLSVAGERAGIRRGESRAVWSVFDLLPARVEDRPRWMMFENVPGLLTSHGGADFRALVRAINDAGYGLDAARVDARHFTAQSRPRLYLMATRVDVAEEMGVERADVDAVEETGARPAAVVGAMRASRDLVWHARELPALPRGGATFEDVAEVPPEGSPGWWPQARAEYFMGQIHPAHAGRARGLIGAGRVTHTTAFRRVRETGEGKRSVIELRTDGLAGCLRTPKGGSARQIVFRAGRGEWGVRHVTAREAARLQGGEGELPGGFGETRWLFALGDAVCVPAARWAIDALTEGGGHRIGPETARGARRLGAAR